MQLQSEIHTHDSHKLQRIAIALREVLVRACVKRRFRASVGACNLWTKLYPVGSDPSSGWRHCSRGDSGIERWHLLGNLRVSGAVV